MGDLKPLGSEKLQGDEKIKRILEIANYQRANDNTNTVLPHNVEYISKSANGVYGIVRENNKYYVKKGLNENTLDYIGGMFMMKKNEFTSYSSALKRLNLLRGQENLYEETRYVLTPNKMGKTTETTPAVPPMPDSTEESPMPEAPPVGDEAQPSGTETTGEDLPPENEMGGDEASGDEMGGEDSGIKDIQKLAGKLGEKISNIGDMEEDDIKWIVNTILSQVEVEKLSDSDKEEIISKIEGNDSEDEFGGDEEGSDEELPTDDGTEEMDTTGDDSELGSDEGLNREPEDDLGETIDHLDEFINTEFDFGDDEKELDEYDDDGFSEEEDEYENIDEDGLEDEESIRQRAHDLRHNRNAGRSEISIEELNNYIQESIKSTLKRRK